ncbi:MAG: hypothetical protein IQL11_09145 [Bacteroidales bacterium]|nr:hypothetical protein [Bacteroidales bacterium]
MKTRIKNQKMNVNGLVIVLTVTLMFFSAGASAQDQDPTRALFKPGVEFSELWTPEVKVNRIQGDIGTLIGFYGGVLINRTYLIGISGGVNLGHPRINYGYFGGIAQYIYKPQDLVHFSTQILMAYGTTKDYENPKSGLMDNFWNISGARFFLTEPGINIEINMSSRTTLVAGISYRYVCGLNENDENVSITNVTNKELSGINFNIGLKFGKKIKVK